MEPLPPPENLREHSSETIETEPNAFGLYRVYSKMPSYDPKEDISLDSVGSHALFLNRMVFYLMSWFYSGSNMKSVGELDQLINKIL